MENKEIDETIENEEDVILTEEEIKDFEGKKDEDLTDEEKKNKKLYARAKSAEEKRKAEKDKFEKELSKLKSELEEAKKKPNDDKNNNIEKKEVELDPIEFAKKIRALSELTDEQISYAQILAKGMNKSVEEAIKSDEFKIWSDAKNELEKKSKGLDPDGRKINEKKKDEFFEKFSKNLPKGFEINK